MSYASTATKAEATGTIVWPVRKDISLRNWLSRKLFRVMVGWWMDLGMVCYGVRKGGDKFGLGIFCGIYGLVAGEWWGGGAG